MQTSDPRRCKICERWLWSLRDKYLCSVCWLVFDKEETLAYTTEQLSKLCVFVKDECQAGFYYTCVMCNKCIFVNRQEDEEYQRRVETMFAEAPQRRLQKEEEDAAILKVCKEREDAFQVYRKLRSLSAEQLKNLRIVEATA